MDHVLPQSLGGDDRFENLALACRRCNERRSNFLVGLDPESQVEVALFNPRQNAWMEHFLWSTDGTKILGITATGRSTVARLDMNDESRSGKFIQVSRRIWIRMGLYIRLEVILN